MEIKTKVFKRKSGKSEGKWVARVSYIDDLTGERKTVERLADKKGQANDKRDALVRDIKKTQGQIRTGERMTFNQLVDKCKAAIYKPAVIVEGRKVAGVRSIDSVNIYIDTLKQFFGKRAINSLTPESLNEYRLWRIKIGSRKPHLIKEKKFEPVKIATINRELSIMRRMMRYAYSKGWTVRDIFFGAGVIDRSAELERKRILTRDEESRLLDCCQGEREVIYKRTLRGRERTETARIKVDNPHLRAMIILALDSGMRRGEIFKLRWADIDFAGGYIKVVGSHTKTERERLAPLSDRARAELRKIKDYSPDRPFPFTDIKRSFNTAKRLAGIEDLHFHDLRRTAITRWQQAGIPLGTAGKLAGHTEWQTTLKHYTAADEATVREVTDKINADLERFERPIETETLQ